jgi:CDP-diglyceride synthetase
MKKTILYAGVILIFAAGFIYADDLSDVLGQPAGKGPVAAGIIGNLSMWGLIGGLLFSSAGVFAFLYGKKKSNAAFIVIGILLALYTFFVQQTVAIFAIGAALCGALYFFRRL